jgi:hypothetical protein
MPAYINMYYFLYFEVLVVNFWKQQINGTYALYCGIALPYGGTALSKTMNGLISGKRLFYMTKNNHIRAQLKGNNLNKMVVDHIEKWYACIGHMKNGRNMKTVIKYKPH